MARFNVTIRHGGRGYRYHTFDVEAPDLAEALRAAAADLPEDVRMTGDLVEIRSATDPDERAFLEE
jgi:hypothetical protein